MFPCYPVMCPFRSPALARLRNGRTSAAKPQISPFVRNHSWALAKPPAARAFKKILSAKFGDFVPANALRLAESALASFVVRSFKTPTR